MIGRLRGRLLERRPTHLLVDVGGVGYDVMIPLSSFYQLPDDAESVDLFIHTHVREDVLQLFGFLRAAERRVFRQLIAISGVGPRLAIAFLSGIGVEELVVAIADGDRARLQRIPGVGKKTAERVLLELRDKLSLDEDDAPLPANPEESASGVRSDALSALINLGYSRDKASKALDKAIDEGSESLEAVIRSALQQLIGSR